MMKKDFLFGIFSLILMFSACFYACEHIVDDFSGSSRPNRTIVKILPSPNEKYNAVIWTSYGGGAAGWCSQYVSVNPQESPFDLEKEADHGGYVFIVSCGSKILLMWTDDVQLHVSYSMQPAGVSTYQKPLGSDEKVKIFYEIKQ